LKRQIAAVLTVTENRDEFFERRKPLIEEEYEKVRNILSKEFDLIYSDLIRDTDAALYWADEAVKRQADVVIIHLPVWASPNLSAKIACNVNVPVMLLGNDRPETSSMVGLLAAAGALEQANIKVKRALGNFEDGKLKDEVVSFVKACHTLSVLRRSNYCQVGGRSIGIITTTADFSKWQELFGIECDHRDQLEVVRKAESMDPDRTKLYMDWLEQNIGKINFGGLFTPESLRKQVNSYLALKDMAREGHYDFMGLKCQMELSDGYAIGCLAIALLGDNYDAEGYKEPIPTSCEADSDGALTMKILSVISGGTPSNLMDIRMLKPAEERMVFANCGGMPTYFAGHSNNPSENLKNIHMMESVFGKAGGGTIQYVSKSGPVTLARLFRTGGEYKMAIIEGEFEDMPREELRKTTYCFPHGFVKAHIDYDLFFNTIGANHMHAVYGNYAKALQDFCDIKGIKYINYNK